MQIFSIPGAICKNGHRVIGSNPSEIQQAKFCQSCGEKVFNRCDGCNKEIMVKGTYQISDRDSDVYLPLPAFCENCGKAYPWTSLVLEAAKNLINSANELDNTEKVYLVDNLNNIISDKPNTELVAKKIRGLLNKAGNEFTSAFRNVTVNIISEIAKKAMFP